MALFGENFRRCECGHFEFEEKALVVLSKEVRKTQISVGNLRMFNDSLGVVVANQRFAYFCTSCGKELKL